MHNDLFLKLGLVSERERELGFSVQGGLFWLSRPRWGSEFRRKRVEPTGPCKERTHTPSPTSTAFNLTSDRNEMSLCYWVRTTGGTVLGSDGTCCVPVQGWYL